MNLYQLEEIKLSYEQGTLCEVDMEWIFAELERLQEIEKAWEALRKADYV